MQPWLPAIDIEGGSPTLMSIDIGVGATLNIYIPYMMPILYITWPLEYIFARNCLKLITYLYSVFKK